MTGFIRVSIKDNYSLLSPKLRRKEMSGDVHQEDTMGPGARAMYGPVLGREHESAGLGRALLRETAAWRLAGSGAAGERRAPSYGFCVGVLAEDPCGVQTLFSCTWKK